MKDFITVEDGNGKKIRMEVVLTFENYKTNINYIIYKSIRNNNEYYAGRYDPNSRISNIETDLSNEEKKFVEKVFKNFKEGAK